MSDFQELLYDEGYEKVIIIGIGADFLQNNFGESFTENSILPLVLDTTPDYINFDLRSQFGATWKELVILSPNGTTILGRIIMDFDTIEEYEAQIYDIIVDNYYSTSSIDYSTQIQPILNSSCTSCHGGAGGLSLTSYNNAMNGGNSGDVVIPYDYANSILWQYVNSGYMPPSATDLTQTQIDLIAQWIDEGALLEPYEPLQGDVNGDGMINILDIVQLVNIILSDVYQESADLNGDENLNILDIVQLVNIILDG